MTTSTVPPSGRQAVLSALSTMIHTSVRADTAEGVGRVERLTTGIAGGEADDRSSLAVISPAGRLVAFPQQPVVLMARIKNIGERAGAYEVAIGPADAQFTVRG